MIIENLAGRNIGDVPLNSSTRQFLLRVPYEGVFEFLRDFVTLLSHSGRAVATRNRSNLDEPYLTILSQVRGNHGQLLQIQISVYDSRYYTCYG